MTDKTEVAAKPVAWMTEDGRACSAATWNDMPRAIRDSFTIPLYTAPLVAEREWREQQIATLFDAIKHGDKEHQEWLRTKVREHFKDEAAKERPDAAAHDTDDITERCPARNNNHKGTT
jgi:hypothetical protein